MIPLDLQPVARLFRGPELVRDNGDASAIREGNLEHVANAFDAPGFIVDDALHARAKDRRMGHDGHFHSRQIEIQTKLQ